MMWIHECCCSCTLHSRSLVCTLYPVQQQCTQFSTSCTIGFVFVRIMRVRFAASEKSSIDTWTQMTRIPKRAKHTQKSRRCLISYVRHLGTVLVPHKLIYTALVFDGNTEQRAAGHETLPTSRAADVPKLEWMEPWRWWPSHESYDRETIDLFHRHAWKRTRERRTQTHLATKHPIGNAI